MDYVKILIIMIQMLISSCFRFPVRYLENSNFIKTLYRINLIWILYASSFVLLNNFRVMRKDKNGWIPSKALGINDFNFLLRPQAYGPSNLISPLRFVPTQKNLSIETSNCKINRIVSLPIWRTSWWVQCTEKITLYLTLVHMLKLGLTKD